MKLRFASVQSKEQTRVLKLVFHLNPVCCTTSSTLPLRIRCFLVLHQTDRRHPLSLLLRRCSSSRVNTCRCVCDPSSCTVRTPHTKGFAGAASISLNHLVQMAKTICCSLRISAPGYWCSRCCFCCWCCGC